ncbi:MAG: hypothetical protein IT366_00165 [Candidatus Hydrogenedentes bacterium]|nr:hypothetical protein [Candidatus Hydrogenedentota bacterium]
MPVQDTIPDYEHMPAGVPMDETDVSVRAYLSRLADDHLAQYELTWTDDQVMDWDGNFRLDGNLMLVCVERDVDIKEFRHVLEDHLRFRGIWR